MLLLLATSLSGAERIAVLPFVETGEQLSARAELSAQIHNRLARANYDIVAEDTVALALRELRLRNTAAPLTGEMQALAERLATDYLLVGTIHRLRTDTVLSESSVCARLVRVTDMNVTWSNCIAFSGGGTISLVSQPATRNLQKLVRKTAAKLLDDFRTEPKPSRTEVIGVLVGKRERRTLDCTVIAVIPPTDEQKLAQGSEMVGDYLAAALRKRGFRVADRGRVRGAMLAGEDLRYGQSVRNVSRRLYDSLGVNLVLTGSISELTGTRDVSLGGSPAAALELRFVDPLHDVVLWAETLERGGDDSKSLFELGVVHSPAVLVHQMVDEFVGDLRLVRRRVEHTQGN